MTKTSKLATAFNVWYSNADMPELQNGVWVDLETGLPFMPIAKVEVFDGQDLEGTALQQKSAGKIRNKMMAQLTAEQAEVIAKITVAKWFLNCKAVLIANIARYCNAHIAMTKAGNRKQLQWLADDVGLGFGRSTFHIDGKGELPATSTIARIEAIIAKEKAIAEEEAAKQAAIDAEITRPKWAMVDAEMMGSFTSEQHIRDYMSTNRDEYDNFCENFDLLSHSKEEREVAIPELFLGKNPTRKVLLRGRTKVEMEMEG